MIQKFLDFVERVGNRLPDPVTIFLAFCFLILGVSWLGSLLSLSVTHPVEGTLIEVQNLFAKGQFQQIFTQMVENFALFPPLGLVLVTMIGIGVAERSGLITAALKKMVTLVPPVLLPATLVLGGVLSNMAADAGYVVLTPLGAVLFAAFGRHPLAGLAAAFAGVSGGFSANLLLTALDPLLSGLSTKSAQVVDPNYIVHASANYYFMLASTLLIVLAGTFVTTKIVEPRLGEWKPQGGQGEDERELQTLKPREFKGLVAAMIVFVICSIAIFFSVYPEDALFRADDGGIGPFYESLVPIIMITFLMMGIVYGVIAGTIRGEKDVVSMSNETMASMGGYIILAFIAAQFVAYFKWSNLGVIIAIAGAEFLQMINLSGIPLMLSFIIVTGVLNIFIGSASAKWAIMGPVFVPMFMLMGYSPELIQTTYRIGDSVTNIISPLLPYYPIIIAFAKKYDPKMGIGTLVSVMLPYSIVFFLLWSVMLISWMGLGLDLGPAAPLNYNLAP